MHEQLAFTAENRDAAAIGSDDRYFQHFVGIAFNRAGQFPQEFKHLLRGDEFSQVRLKDIYRQMRSITKRFHCHKRSRSDRSQSLLPASSSAAASCSSPSSWLLL